MKITRFEDLDAWKRARVLNQMICDATESIRFDRSRKLRDQLQAAALSSMANTAEGFDSGSDRELVRFL